MSIGIENILGTKAKIRFEDWIPDKPDSALSILRSEPWYKPAPEKRKTPSEKFGEGAPPTEFDDLGKFGHRDRRVFSIIDVPLWNRAKWDGTAYLYYGPTYPPLLGIMFGDEEAGRQIFEAWRKRFGAFDRDDEIRLAILTGFDRSNPNHYRVAIGPNINRVDMRSENYSLWLHEFRQ